MILALAASLAIATSAGQAPPIKVAQKRAAQEARSIARVVSTPTARIISTGATGCRRKPSLRATDCKMVFNYTQGQRCTWKLRVRYVSRTSRKLRVTRLGRPVC